MSTSSFLSVTVFFPGNGNVNLFTANTRITGKLLVYHKYKTEPSKQSLKLTKPQEKKYKLEVTQNGPSVQTNSNRELEYSPTNHSQSHNRPPIYALHDFDIPLRDAFVKV